MKSFQLIVVAVVGMIVSPWLLVGPSAAQQQQAPAARAPQRMARIPRDGAPPAAAMPALPPAPSWVPLPPKHQQYLDQILKYWEYKSNQVKRYRCKFKRWKYEPVFGPTNTFVNYSEGIIKYSAPDKGLFRVEKSLQYQPPKEKGGKPKYEPLPKEQLECWICDGHWVYQYDYSRKKLFQHELPPDMRGQAIGKGPLPFLFNAKADDIKRRFWVHIVTPVDVKKEYWLEAVPKTQEDAANFQRIRVVIDEADFLPKAMIVFGRVIQKPGKASPPASKQTYQFEDRDINFSILAQQLNLFHREFYEPDVPRGWAKVVERWEQPAMPPDMRAAGKPAPSRQRLLNRR